VGTLVSAIGGYSVVNTRRFLAHAVTTPGVVIENVYRESSDGGGTYHPRVRFHTREGQEFVFLSGFGSDPAAYRVNDTVEVLYDPGKPGDAAVHSFWSQWLTAVILFSLGGTASLVGIIPLAWRRLRK